mmetsp:Transcript_39500/g.126623  ORF Transcript_39500/g.126623 Transcript_39500/m.126623 type:complete len:224 (-) Transcript_39500:743-1414(-)
MVSLHLPLEQCLQRRLWPDRHCNGCVCVVLHGSEKPDSSRGSCLSHRRPVSPRLCRLGVLRCRGGSICQIRGEVHREAVRGPEQQGDGLRSEVPSVLHLVLREDRPVPEQECIHPDRALGETLLHLGQESFLLDPSERGPLWHTGGFERHGPFDRLHFHHDRHRCDRLLLTARDASRRFALHAPRLLQLCQLRGREDLHERLRPCSRHISSVLLGRGGDGCRR